MAAEFAKSGGYDYDEEFEIALNLILDAIEQFKQQGPSRKRGKRSG